VHREPCIGPFRKADKTKENHNPGGRMAWTAIAGPVTGRTLLEIEYNGGIFLDRPWPNLGCRTIYEKKKFNTNIWSSIYLNKPTVIYKNAFMCHYMHVINQTREQKKKSHFHLKPEKVIFYTHFTVHNFFFSFKICVFFIIVYQHHYRDIQMCWRRWRWKWFYF
jgi:hypothetical protein